MSSSYKTTPSKGFTCDCKKADNNDTKVHSSSCWKVPKCDACGCRNDKLGTDCCYCEFMKGFVYST